MAPTLPSTAQKTAPSSEPAVSVRAVNKVFGDFHAVRDASFDLPKGRFLTILGPSGSGKTTLLRMIAALMRRPRAKSSSAANP